LDHGYSKLQMARKKIDNLNNRNLGFGKTEFILQASVLPGCCLECPCRPCRLPQCRCLPAPLLPCAPAALPTPLAAARYAPVALCPAPGLQTHSSRWPSPSPAPPSPPPAAARVEGLVAWMWMCAWGVAAWCACAVRLCGLLAWPLASGSGRPRRRVASGPSGRVGVGRAANWEWLRAVPVPCACVAY